MKTNVIKLNDSNSVENDSISQKLEKSRPTTNKFIQAEDYLSCNFDLRYNTISLNIEGKRKNETSYKVVNENDLFIELNKAGVLISLNHLLAILKSNYVKEYDPFKHYFESLPKWDEQFDYIKFLATHVKAVDQENFYYHFKKWIVRVVATAIEDNYFNKQALILVHSKQNSGKSTFCRFLCPPSLRDYIAEDFSFDKDSRIALAKNLIINIDELSTLDKTDINKLKATLSKDKINERLPYDRKNSIISRKCSFLGSTNKTEFLTDETGSCRWLCIEISEINWLYKNKVNIDQVYSQAYSLYKSKAFEYDMTIEDIAMIQERNKSYEFLTTERELIETYFQPAREKEEYNFRTATDITMRLSTIVLNTVKINPVQIGKALTALGYEITKNKKKRKGYFIIEKLNPDTNQVTLPTP